MLVAEKSGKFFNSRVFHEEDFAVKTVWPKTVEARRMLFNEHDILMDFDSPDIVKCVDFQEKNGVYILVTEWVEPQPVMDWDTFRLGLNGIIGTLEKAGVRHRDIRPQNIIAHDNLPVLIDFGWAHRESDIPEVPDEDLENPDDRKAMDKILEYIDGH